MMPATAIRAAPAEKWEPLRTSDLAFPINRLTVVRADEPLLTAVQRIDSGDIRTGLVVDDHGRTIGTVDARALYDTAETRRGQLAPSGRG